MYIKVNKIEYIWFNCQLGGLFQYKKAKIILEIEKTIDLNFFIILALCANFFLVGNLVNVAKIAQKNYCTLLLALNYESFLILN